MAICAVEIGYHDSAVGERDPEGQLFWLNRFAPLDAPLRVAELGEHLPAFIDPDTPRRQWIRPRQTRCGFESATHTLPLPAGATSSYWMTVPLGSSMAAWSVPVWAS